MGTKEARPKRAKDGYRLILKISGRRQTMKIRKSALKTLVEEVMSERDYKISDTADGSYKERRTQMDKDIKTLQAALKKMDAKQKKDPKNWGYTGNLGKIADDMEEIIRFVSRS